MKYPLVIVEGPDGAGKSTLIQSLAQVPGIPYIWRISASRRPKAIAEVHRMTDEAVRLGWHSMPVVLDRHAYISEPIYGTVVRDRPVIYWEAIEDIPSLLKQINTLIVYCRPDKEVIRAGIRSMPQMDGVIQHLDEIILQYDLRIALLMSVGCNVMAYDWTAQDAVYLWQAVYEDVLK